MKSITCCLNGCQLEQQRRLGNATTPIRIHGHTMEGRGRTGNAHRVCASPKNQTHISPHILISLYPSTSVSGGMLTTCYLRGTILVYQRGNQRGRPGPVIWGFPKIGGTLLGVPIIRIIVFVGLYWGPLILGNYHLGIELAPSLRM